MLTLLGRWESQGFKEVVLISVTQNDIDQGNSYADNCPIAKAAEGLKCIAVAPNMQCHYSLQVKVFTAHLQLLNRNNFKSHACIRLPRAAQRFVKRFDKNQSTKPFSFRLVLPDWVKVDWERVQMSAF